MIGRLTITYRIGHTCFLVVTVQWWFNRIWAWFRSRRKHTWLSFGDWPSMICLSLVWCSSISQRNRIGRSHVTFCFCFFWTVESIVEHSRSSYNECSNYGASHFGKMFIWNLYDGIIDNPLAGYVCEHVMHQRRVWPILIFRYWWVNYICTSVSPACWCIGLLVLK